MRILKLLTVTTTLCVVAWFTSGQSLNASEKNKKHYGYPDITYKVREAGPFANFVNSILVPKNPNGAGVVLLSGCRGIGDKNIQDLRRLANELLEKGYSVATPDYNSGPRPDRSPWNCGRNKNLQDMRLIKDIYDATTALSKVQGIDANRIFTVGQSLGAQFGALAIGNLYVDFATKNGWGPVPRAVIGLYGGCQYSYGLRKYLHDAIARPVLWMAGAEDIRSYQGGNGCSKEQEQKIIKAQPDSKFVVFENASHCWDCLQMNGFYNSLEGQSYYYNSKATKQSRDEIFKFMEKFK